MFETAYPDKSYLPKSSYISDNDSRFYNSQ